MRSYAHLPTRLSWDRFSSLEFFAQLDEATRNAAGDRSGGQLERLPDRPVSLVACKEAVEDLAAVLGQARHRVMDVERLGDPRESLDERRPRLLAAVAATGDELRGRNRLCHGALLDRDLLLLRLSAPLGHHLKELPGDLGVRLDEGPELP